MPIISFISLLADVFPGVDYVPIDLDSLREHIVKVCAERRLVKRDRWIAKILQLYQIQKNPARFNDGWLVREWQGLCLESVTGCTGVIGRCRSRRMCDRSEGYG